MKQREIVEKVVTAIRRGRSHSFLIEMAPGCEQQPDLLSKVHEKLCGVGTIDCAVVSADAVENEDELVEVVLDGWRTAGERRDEDRDVVQSGGESATRRLREFFAGGAARSGRTRVLMIRKFDKVFRNMSGALLAVLRDLEQEEELISVNVSPLRYAELYRRRAEEERSFTSDYGQMHVRVTVGKLGREEAEDRWYGRHGLALEGIWRACFGIAYEMSGGVPVAFDAAAAYTKAIVGEPEVREFRAEIRERVPETFDRLLQYDTGAGRMALVRAIGRCHLGIENDCDRRLIWGHPFRGVVLADEGRSGRIELCSGLLGARAARLMRESADDVTLDPRELYRRRQFGACVDVLADGPGGGKEVLAAAAEMMYEVYGDEPGSLYFDRRVDWRKVDLCAERAAQECEDRGSAAEFRNWAAIARAHAGQANRTDGIVAIEEDIRHSIVYLAVRTLASERDDNGVTGAYTAIPMVEDALRRYVSLVLLLPLEGSVFAKVSDGELEKWWRRGDGFIRPDGETKLAGAELALLAAVVSEARGCPLFSEPAELSRLIGVLDEARNQLAHFAVTPSGEVKGKLVRWTKRVIDAMASQSGVALDVDRVDRWIEPPLEFLKGQ